MWKIWYVHPHFSLAAVYIELLSVHSGNLNSLKYSNSLEWPIFFKHRCNCLMFWWKHNTYFYIKRLSKHRRKRGFLVVLFLWYSVSKLFSFRVSSFRRLSCLHEGFQGRSTRWIVNVKQFPLESPSIILRSQMCTAVSLTVSKLNLLCLLLLT